MTSYRIKVKNGGAVYRVPEDMLPSVASAMVDGGTATRLDEQKKPEASALAGAARNAAKFIGAPFRHLGIPSAERR